MKLFQDGNIIGRIGALVVLAAVGLWLGGVCSADFCPIPSKSSGCCFSSTG